MQPPPYNGTSSKQAEIDLNHVTINSADSSSDEEIQDGDDDYDETEQNCFSKMVTRTQSNMADFWADYNSQLKYLVASIFVLGYAVYFGYAMSYEFGSESSIRLLWMTLLGVFICIVSIIKEYYGDAIKEHVFDPIVAYVEAHYKVCKM